jgi:hypothetical protein
MSQWNEYFIERDENDRWMREVHERTLENCPDFVSYKASKTHNPSIVSTTTPKHYEHILQSADDTACRLAGGRRHQSDGIRLSAAEGYRF